MELLKMLSGNEIVAQILCFFLLLFLLKHFAWKKILDLLDQRKEKISSQLGEIENTKLEFSSYRDYCGIRNGKLINKARAAEFELVNPEYSSDDLKSSDEM